MEIALAICHPIDSFMCWRGCRSFYSSKGLEAKQNIFLSWCAYVKKTAPTPQARGGTTDFTGVVLNARLATSATVDCMPKYHWRSVCCNINRAAQRPQETAGDQPANMQRQSSHKDTLRRRTRVRSLQATAPKSTLGNEKQYHRNPPSATTRSAVAFCAPERANKCVPLTSCFPRTRSSFNHPPRL
jgi:hypothetical protein